MVRMFYVVVLIWSALVVWGSSARSETVLHVPLGGIVSVAGNEDSLFLYPRTIIAVVDSSGKQLTIFGSQPATFTLYRVFLPANSQEELAEVPTATPEIDYEEYAVTIGDKPPEPKPPEPTPPEPEPEPEPEPDSELGKWITKEVSKLPPRAKALAPQLAKVYRDVAGRCGKNLFLPQSIRDETNTKALQVIRGQEESFDKFNRALAAALVDWSKQGGITWREYQGVWMEISRGFEAVK